MVNSSFVPLLNSVSLICYKFDFAKLRIILQLKAENPIKQQLAPLKKLPRIIPQMFKNEPPITLKLTF